MREEQLEAYVDAVSAALGLEIAAAHRPGVVHYLGLAAAMAERVMEFPLESDADPAPVFVPLEPDDADAPAASASP